MKNERFDQAVDEIVELITDVHKLQMDQLKCNIKAVHKANANEIDPNEIAQQIMNLPVNSGLRPMENIEFARPAIHLRDEMLCTAEKYVTIGSVGDLRDLSFVKVGSDIPFGKEFYHHCPEVQNKLVRLVQYDVPNTHKCPICGQKYEQK